MKRFFDFEAHATDFSWINAYTCAHAAQLAYADRETIGRHIEREWGSQEQTQHHDWEFIEDVQTDTQAFVLSTDTFILVAFRGSETPVDLMTDVSLDLIPGTFGGELHEGFARAVDSIWAPLTAAVDRFCGDKSKSLWFTGHSLGASLATITVARFLEERMGQRLAGLYTFGQPRTGNSRFARTFDGIFRSRTFRFVNNNDVVARIPPRLLGYRHIGLLHYFNRHGELRNEQTRWWRFFDQLMGRCAGLFRWGTDGVLDHGMAHYVRLVRRHYLQEQRVQHAARYAARLREQELLSEIPGI